MIWPSPRTPRGAKLSAIQLASGEIETDLGDVVDDHGGLAVPEVYGREGFIP